MKKWEAFFVAFLLMFVISAMLIFWTLQLLNTEGISRNAFMFESLAFILGGFTFGLIPAIPVIYQLEKKG